MQKSRYFAINLTLVAVLAAASGCGGNDTKSDANKVTVAILPSVSAMPVFVAQSKGFFKDEGLTVEIKKFEGGPKTMEAMIAGSVQVAHSGIIPFLNASSKGIEVSAFASTAIKGADDKTNQIFVKKDSGITSLTDLKGKKFAINSEGNFEEFGLKAYAFPANGMTASSVDFISIPYPNMGAALSAGQIDAAIEEEANTSKLASNDALISIDSLGNYLPEKAFPSSVQVAKTTWAEKPEAAAYTRAVTKGLTWAESHPEETIEIVAKETGLSKKIAEAALTNVNFPNTATIETDQWEYAVDAMKKLSFIPKSMDISKHLVVTH